MQSSNLSPLEGILEIDKFSIGGHGKGKSGRSVGKKRKVISGIKIVLKKKQKPTIGRGYARVIEGFRKKVSSHFLMRKFLKSQRY